MNIMGNQAIRNGEITPNNFATKPGAFSKSNILTKPDYLFGSNMGLTAEENNLSVSTNAVRTRLPLPIHFKTPKLGTTGAEAMNTIGMLLFVGGIVHGLANAGNKDASLMQSGAIMATGLLFNTISQAEEV